MPLQTRIASLITAIGADIKRLNTNFANPSLVGHGNMQPHATYTDFNAIPDFGFRFVQGTLNGPGIPGATQYYVVSSGLGSEYAYSQYACQIAIPRNVPGAMATRFREGGTWGPWKVLGDTALLDGGTP